MHKFQVLDVYQFLGSLHVIEKPSKILVTTGHRTLKHSLTRVGHQRGLSLIRKGGEDYPITLRLFRNAKRQGSKIPFNRQDRPNLRKILPRFLSLLMVCEFLTGLTPFQLQFRQTPFGPINHNGANRPQDSGQQQHQREPWNQGPVWFSQLLEHEIHHVVLPGSGKTVFARETS